MRKNGTAWRGRSVLPSVDLPGLGALVDAELDRVDGLLFTATPREDLDEIGRFQRLKDQAFAGQLRAIVAMVVRPQREQREFAPDEVSLALNVGTGTGAGLTHLALDAAELPGLIEAVESGRWTERHLRCVIDELAYYPLTLEQKQAVALILLARYRDETPGELRDLLRRTVLRVDRKASENRKSQAARRRGVFLNPTSDDQGSVWAVGPLDKIAEIGAALQKALADEVRPDGDDRTLDERTFDAYHRLITGGSEAGQWIAHVLVPYTTALGGDLELGEIPGYGPILPSTAADLAADAEVLAKLGIDPTTGEVIGISDLMPGPAASPRTEQREQREPAATGSAAAQAIWDALLKAALHTDPISSSYQVSPRLRRFLEARDRTCTFPGCRRPALGADKDHRVPWPLGRTDRRNMHCLCRRHHRAKQAAFTVRIDRDGNTHWTTRGGWTFTRRPKGY
jgi:hypothetical protein